VGERRREEGRLEQRAPLFLLLSLSRGRPKDESVELAMKKKKKIEIRSEPDPVPFTSVRRSEGGSNSNDGCCVWQFKGMPVVGEGKREGGGGE
jgi:hypothetical protein